MLPDKNTNLYCSSTTPLFANMAGHTSYSAKSPAPLGLPDQLVVVVSVGVCYSQSAASAHNIKQNSTGHHRLIKHPQHCLAHFNGAELPQKVEAALSLLVRDFSVPHSTCLWIKDFLTDRTQRVRVGPHTCTALSLSTGSLQGCVSPALYPLHPQLQLHPRSPQQHLRQICR